jgi:hypothetical protein
MKSKFGKTTASNLESKFNAGENILDYFDVKNGEVIVPQKRGRSKNGLGIKRSSLHSLSLRLLPTAERKIRFYAKKNQLTLSEAVEALVMR